jgi:hypothetical protein
MNVKSSKIKKQIMNIENTKAQMRKGVLEFASYPLKERCYTSVLDTLKA